MKKIIIGSLLLVGLVAGFANTYGSGNENGNGWGWSGHHMMGDNHHYGLMEDSWRENASYMCFVVSPY